MADEFHIIDGKLEGMVDYTKYPEYNAGTLTGAIAEAATSKSQPKVNYKNGDPFKLQSQSNNIQSDPVTDSVWLTDIAQSHHFTVTLEELNLKSDVSRKVPIFKAPGNKLGDFLPVKSIQLNYTSYENMSIPLAIFGDFPLLSRKRASTISLTCYDEDTHQLEYALSIWEAQCFPQNRYVAYMDDIARKLVYRGFQVDGTKTLEVTRIVIPNGNVSVTREYGSNGEKLLTFGLICIGNGTDCQVGGTAGRVPGVTKAGDGSDKSVEKWGPTTIKSQDSVLGRMQGYLIQLGKAALNEINPFNFDKTK